MRKSAVVVMAVALVAGAGGALSVVLFSGGRGSPVTVSIRSITPKSEAACHAYVDQLLAKEFPEPRSQARKAVRRRFFRLNESALCADSARSAWYEVDLHLLRHEETIVGCYSTLLDVRGKQIPVPPLNEPQHILILNPTQGIQAGDLSMQPGHDVRVQWKIAPDDTRGIHKFVQPKCEAIRPDELPS